MSSLIDLAKGMPSVVQFSLYGEKYEFNLTQELEFTTESLDEDITEHTAKVSVLATYYENAKFELAKKQLQYRAAKAAKYHELKNHERTGENKKLTEKSIEALMDNDKALSELREERAALEYEVGLMEKVLDLFKQKKELMQTYSANFRKTT